MQPGQAARGVAGRDVDDLDAVVAPRFQAGISSEVTSPPAPSAERCTWRGGTSQPAANIVRSAGINAANGSAARVAAASRMRSGTVIAVCFSGS